MRRTWGSIGMLVILLVSINGCEPTLKQKLRPAKPPEVYNLPPADDTRFQEPIAYPKNTLNQDETRLTKDAKDTAKMDKDGASGGGAGRMGGGMGGMGGGGMGGP